MGFGVVSLLDAVFWRAFTSAGLRPGSAAVDADTTIHFWAHRSLLPSTATTTEQQQQQKRPVVVLVHGFGPGPTWQWAAQRSLEDRREEKIELIKGMTTAGGSQLTPLPLEVLIIWGEFDQIFPLEKAYVVKEKLGEKAMVKVIPNSGHLPAQEDPKLFNRILLEFLLQLSNSNAAAAL
ncbi:hypothetical protein PVAP13_5NG076300 [Panicum virgatum]|nr:hypothetical protein PVAP13_5NG076300 [Panicum virgatum]